MMKGESDSVVNRGIKKTDAPRWESDKIDIGSIVLERNA